MKKELIPDEKIPSSSSKNIFDYLQDLVEADYLDPILLKNMMAFSSYFSTSDLNSLSNLFTLLEKCNPLSNRKNWMRKKANFLIFEITRLFEGEEDYKRATTHPKILQNGLTNIKNLLKLILFLENPQNDERHNEQAGRFLLSKFPAAAKVSMITRPLPINNYNQSVLNFIIKEKIYCMLYFLAGLSSDDKLAVMIKPCIEGNTLIEVIIAQKNFQILDVMRNTGWALETWVAPRQKLLLSSEIKFINQELWIQNVASMMRSMPISRFQPLIMAYAYSFAGHNNNKKKA